MAALPWSPWPSAASTSDDLIFTPSSEADEAAERLLNPRPSPMSFASLAEREAAHAAVFHEGIAANAAGDLDLACERFSEAYSLLFDHASLLSLINMKLKLGEAELAAATYAKMLDAGGHLLNAGESRRLVEKLDEARSLHARARSILCAPQAALLNSAADREKSHRRLVDKAKGCCAQKEWDEAERLFLEAWPLTFRVTTLISAANMMIHGSGPQLRLAISIYSALLRNASPRLGRSPLSADEEAIVQRKLAEAKAAICRDARS